MAAQPTVPPELIHQNHSQNLISLALQHQQQHEVFSDVLSQVQSGDRFTPTSIHPLDVDQKLIPPGVWWREDRKRWEARGGGNRKQNFPVKGYRVMSEVEFYDQKRRELEKACNWRREQMIRTGFKPRQRSSRAVGLADLEMIADASPKLNIVGNNGRTDLLVVDPSALRKNSLFKWQQRTDDPMKRDFVNGDPCSVQDFLNSSLMNVAALPPLRSADPHDVLPCALLCPQSSCGRMYPSTSGSSVIYTPCAMTEPVSCSETQHESHHTSSSSQTDCSGASVRAAVNSGTYPADISAGSWCSSATQSVPVPINNQFMGSMSGYSSCISLSSSSDLPHCAPSHSSTLMASYGNTLNLPNSTCAGANGDSGGFSSSCTSSSPFVPLLPPTVLPSIPPRFSLIPPAPQRNTSSPTSYPSSSLQPRDSRCNHMTSTPGGGSSLTFHSHNPHNLPESSSSSLMGFSDTSHAGITNNAVPHCGTPSNGLVVGGQPLLNLNRQLCVSGHSIISLFNDVGPEVTSFNLWQKEELNIDNTSVCALLRIPFQRAKKLMFVTADCARMVCARDARKLVPGSYVVVSGPREETEEERNERELKREIEDDELEDSSDRIDRMPTGNDHPKLSNLVDARLDMISPNNVSIEDEPDNDGYTNSPPSCDSVLLGNN
eukprot:Filipodium_phascolosomae@DN1291_c0_g1_i1.p1